MFRRLVMAIFRLECIYCLTQLSGGQKYIYIYIYIYYYIENYMFRRLVMAIFRLECIYCLTQLSGGDIYYYIENNYMFRRLIKFIFRLYMKHTLSTYTKHVYGLLIWGQGGGKVGTRSRICPKVGWCGVHGLLWTIINLLAPELFFKFQYTLYIKCE